MNRAMNISDTENYKSFIKNNMVEINKRLNKIMCFFIVIGPALAIGIKTGIFDDVKYITCLNISVGMGILAAIHFVLVKRKPESAITSIVALTAMDALIVYMAYSHISIHLTWFVIPLMSLLFCDRFLYFYTVILNYVLMFVTTWFTSPFNVLQRADHITVNTYFAETIAGLTIETVVMVSAGYAVLKLSIDYFKELFLKNQIITERQNSVKEEMNILGSMAEIYDNVNFINFVENTEMSLRDPEQKKHGIDMSRQTHTLMNQKIMKQVMPDQLEEFLTFTNITTVRSRLINKKVISADFIDIVAGWFRAQYITVDAGPDGVPNTVIYTIRNVDDDKKREEYLLRISMTDEMTRLFNRRCYDENLTEYRNGTIPEDFVLMSVDVNGLKKVNDTLGHAAGDELIKGAADCLALSVGSRGKTYRTGGDEFMAIVHADNPEEIRRKIHETVGRWHGHYCDELTVSVGYAAYASHKEATVDELERIADADMYEEKKKHYIENGIERRYS